MVFHDPIVPYFLGELAGIRGTCPYIFMIFSNQDELHFLSFKNDLRCLHGAEVEMRIS